MSKLAVAEIDSGVVHNDKRDLPIFADVDVVVAGGGMSGYAAALTASRMGARTILLESGGFLGGLLTGCLAEVVQWHNDETGRQIIAGVWEETKQRMIKLGGTPGQLIFDGPMWGPHVQMPKRSPTVTPFDPEILKFVMAEQVLEAGAQLQYHAMAVGVVKESNRVRGVVIDGKSGRAAVLGKVVVDATGDADVCYAAGAPYLKGRKNDGRMMGATLHAHAHGVEPGPLWEYVRSHPDDVPRWAQLLPLKGGAIPPNIEMMRFACHGFQISMQAAKARGELYFTRGELGIWPSIGRGRVELNVSRIDEVDGTDIKDLSKSQIEGRKQLFSVMNFLRREIPGFQAAYISQVAPEVQFRETRRIVCDYSLSDEDVLRGTRFDDTVALASYPSEVHPPETGQRMWGIPERYYQVPYRIFHPKGVEFLILGSARSLSTSQVASGAVRQSPIPIATGQAAGVAAALSVKKGITPAKIPAEDVRQELKRQGAVVD
jgi:hypothetical protein